MPSIYIAIKNTSEAESLPNDARELILHIDAVSVIGEDAGIKRLDEYVYAPLDEIFEFLINFGATEEELEKADIEVWYEPEEGGKIIGDYINLVESYNSLSETVKNSVISELKQFHKILEVLIKENNKWRFQYDI